jgi:hypothetical protein
MIKYSVRLPPSTVTTLISVARSFVGVCSWRVAADCRGHYQNEKPSKGDASFKTVKIRALFEDMRMNSVNHVSSMRWQELRGLSPRPLHIL